MYENRPMTTHDAYEEFLSRKLAFDIPTGLSVDTIASAHHLFDFQIDLVKWALRRGRAAIFADTGLGKTRMQLAWANMVPSSRVLILAPLAVAKQTADEGARMGINVNICREESDVMDGINIANYERLHRFAANQFGAIILDESSCIKHHETKTLAVLLSTFDKTAFKLCATATPSPNDYTELGTHAEFLGICSRVEMLAEFFCHDGGETQVWRLKKHARRVFWEWVATWGAMLRKPSDLGYDDTAYHLPTLHVHDHIIAADPESLRNAGLLFASPASGMAERRSARRGSLSERVRRCSELVNASDSPWVIWCDLNDESKMLGKSIPGSVEISGSDSIDEKELRLSEFASGGKIRVLISKPSICGWGLNWQHCHNMAFVGITDSWEAYYQAVRRIYRFGQASECNVHIFASEIEGSVVSNLKRKELAANQMATELSVETALAVRRNIAGQRRVTNPYLNSNAIFPGWLYSDMNSPE